MTTDSSLITLLQPPPPVETPAVSQTRNSGEENHFQNMLEEASRNVKPSEESASAGNERQDESALSNNKSKTDQSSRAADSGKKTEDNPGLKNDETFESELTSTESELTSANQGVEDNRDLSLERANSLADSRNAFVEKLKSLGIDQEKIDAFLRLLEVDATAADAHEMIMALAGQLDLQQGEALKNSLINLQEGEKSASALNTRDRLVVDFLHKAGLNEAEAKHFLQRIAQAQAKTNVLNSQETQDIKPTITTEAKSLEDTARASHAQGREAGSAMTGELINKQRLEAQKLSSREQTARVSEGLSSERIKIQDPLAKVLNAPQSRQNSSSENAPQVTLLNSLNLRNSLDNVSPLDQGSAKISVESLAQNSAQSAGKLSGQTEALKEAAKETPLPRGVTESKVIDQIVRKFSMRGAGAKSEIHIRLEPASLGTVRMNISMVGDTMKTTIIAESHAVRLVIESNLSQLKDSLSQQGFNVESFDVLVGGDTAFKGQQQLGNGRSKGFSSDNPLDQETPEQLAPESLSPLFAGTGKINVFA